MLPNLEIAREELKENEVRVKCFSCRNDLYSILKANGIATIYNTKNLVTGKNCEITYNSNICFVCGKEWLVDEDDNGNCVMSTNRGEILFPKKKFCDIKNK